MASQDFGVVFHVDVFKKSFVSFWSLVRAIAALELLVITVELCWKNKNEIYHKIIYEKVCLDLGYCTCLVIKDDFFDFCVFHVILDTENGILSIFIEILFDHLAIVYDE